MGSIDKNYGNTKKAADTITSMKQHSLKMIANIERLKKLQQNPTSKSNVTNFESEKLSRRFDETTARAQTILNM